MRKRRIKKRVWDALDSTPKTTEELGLVVRRHRASIAQICMTFAYHGFAKLGHRQERKALNGVFDALTCRRAPEHKNTNFEEVARVIDADVTNQDKI